MRFSSWVIVFSDNDAKILLGKRGKNINNPEEWNFFGGGMEKGEKPIDTAVRELSEEYGLKIPGKKLIRLGKIKDLKVSRIYHYFLLILKNPSLKPGNNENSQIKMFDFKDLPNKMHRPTNIFFNSKISKTIKKELVRKSNELKRMSNVNAALSPDSSPVEILDSFQPIMNNYNKQIQILKQELIWAYEHLDKVNRTITDDMSNEITSHLDAVRAVSIYNLQWFKDLPVSYGTLSDIAEVLKEQMLEYLPENNIPDHIKDLVNDDFREISLYRSTDQSPAITEFQDEPEEEEDRGLA